MAQAPGGFGGGGGGGGEEAPRQNKTIKQYQGMQTQNERNAIPEGQFHWLENIQPIGPGNLHSIPGRGPLGVEIPQPSPPVTCTDLTERGQASISIVTAFDLESAWLVNQRASWGFIHNGELYALLIDGDCGGGNSPYTDVCCKIAHYINDVPTVHDFLLLPTSDPSALFVNSRIGTADRTVWAAVSNSITGGFRVYYDVGASFVNYTIPSINFGGHDVSSYAVKGNELWVTIPCCPDIGGNPIHVCRFDRTLGGVPTLNTTPWGATDMIVSNAQLTGSSLYVLASAHAAFPANEQKIYQIDRSTGLITASFDVSYIGANFICVADDNLIYLVVPGAPAAVYYLKNFSELIYVGKTLSGFFVPFGLGTGVWNNGKIYWGSNGFGGFSTNISRIDIPCPDGSPPSPVIASIATGSTVAAGSAINVTWSNILLPDATDKIQLAPAPAAGLLGWLGATATQQTTSSLSSGTISFAIPGGTTPGNYIFQLVTQNGAILIATSNVFTVT